MPVNTLQAVTLLELQHANSSVTNYITSTRQLEMVLTPPSTPPSFLSYKLFALKMVMQTGVLHWTLVAPTHSTPLSLKT